MEAQGEQLLQSLVNHEQTLVAKVEEAKKEAAEIVKEAEVKAEQTKAEAKSKAEQYARDQAEQTRSEGEAAREAVLSEARKDVEMTQERAKGNQAKAVAFVMEQVLP